MTRPSIYVAGAVAEVDRAAAAVAALRSHGFEITHDWPTDAEAVAWLRGRYEGET